MKRLALIGTALGLLLSPVLLGFQPPAPPSAPPAPIKVDANAIAAKKPVDRWYVLMMQGKRAGYQKSVEKTENGRITTSSEMHMEIKRGPIAIKVLVESEFVETTDGKPVSMMSNQDLGGMMTTKTVSVFSEDGIESTATNGNQKTTTKKPLPKEAWMTPAAAERYVKAELAKGAKEIKVTSIDPTAGEGVMTVTRKIVDSGEVEVFGKTVPAVKWESTVDKFPGVKQTEYVDAQGEVLKSVTNMGGISLEQLAADKELAMSKLDAPELLESTTVKPSKPLSNPRHLANATYRVSVEKDEMPELPTAAGQRFRREDARTGMVEQEARGVEVVPADKLEAVKSEHLASSSAVKADDPVIVELAKSTGFGGLKSPERAEKMREFVHSYIKTKNMSVGFATASEVARTKVGDCTEHAVLLAALLRSVGVPSRCASGLVYVEQFAGQEGIFGYHMWTQALVEQPDGSWGWVNVDATLPKDVPYDAAHILLSVSALGEGEMQNFLVTTAPLIGRLKIEVVEAK